MAKDTSKTLRNQMLYSVFVRNYGKTGTFKEVEADLARIKDLGTDIIWLLPIQPNGVEHRKGSIGSPYAISDYRAVDPRQGSLEDFISLCEKTHALGMKIIIDCVYNHTSPDSVLFKEHPEWFYYRKDGRVGNKIGDWWDVVDLDYNQKDLWAYQIETLCYWAQWVDGFRCDVAPLVPREFWAEAREAVAKVRPGAIWLSESVEREMIRDCRKQRFTCLSDSEIYTAFDAAYEYDIYWYFNRYLTGEGTLKEYAEQLNLQEGIFPDNYVKLRYLENHDKSRAHFLIPDEQSLRNFTAFLYFQKGLAMVYAGQEIGMVHQPTLFEMDPLDWEAETFTKVDLTDLMKRLKEIKKEAIFTDSSYEAIAMTEDCLVAIHDKNIAPGDVDEKSRAVGIFPFKGQPQVLTVRGILEDGVYTEQISGRKVEVNLGQIATAGEAMILGSYFG